ncbi:DUF3090 family protein [Arachnia propionica]|uniref:DUF3090 family protein n=1 Tax=Arachnia propionica TaxID=1750 RepID=A0A3P1WU35_9ACTN|nr:DUF3090 family protein [Arachnia propionica]RRD48880.1 DUF3090 family protein [Arachnia propionica]
MLLEFPHPDRVVVGALGDAGERTFVLQVRQRDQLAAVQIERDAVLSVARRIDSLLEESVLLGWLGEPPGEIQPDLGPLDEPLVVLFTVRAVGWALDTARGAIQVELFAGSPERETELLDTIIQIWLYPRVAREFTARVRHVIATTDPPCPFCAQPVHALGHICPRANGYRAPLF